MEIILGYACLNTSIPNKMRSLRLKTYLTKGDEYLKSLVINNLNYTKTCLKWNMENNVHFFRISSDIVPLATHSKMKFKWWKDEDIQNIANDIKNLASKNSIRLSMHPGQYTLLNSNKEEVVDRSIQDLKYHQIIGNMMGVEDLITHVGGVYGNREKAMERWASVYKSIPTEVASLIRLENDDRLFTIKEVLELSKETGVQAVFDYHHHRINPSIDAKEAMVQSIKTWEGTADPKVHLSSGKSKKLDSRHHDLILKEDYQELLSILPKTKDSKVYIMLEAKKKEQAIINLRKSI